ncbi:hypothetical protein RUM4293_02927 [Ruegeria atlantica]|uniref:Uncharacterized protein n=1 Tax=Ruegeria atlantica TaxID=81569 RepID=A0A0P1E7J5_9RHOB|nr:hypothetical protein RUM4293_02927 [Ruegeria atlantica]
MSRLLNSSKAVLHVIAPAFQFPERAGAICFGTSRTDGPSGEMVPGGNVPLLLPPDPGPGYERFSNRKQARGISCAESL